MTGLQMLAILIACFIGQLLIKTIYNLFFHPLRGFPGPISCHISLVPSAYHCWSGNGIKWITNLHKQYGDVVRIAPNELSFSGADALRDIYGFAKGRMDGLQKDPDFYGDSSRGPVHIGNCDAASHTRLRRIFSPAFSARALKLQEPIFKKHAENMIDQTRHRLLSGSSDVLDMVTVYTCTVADIISHLVLGESLNTLETMTYHSWLEDLLEISHQGIYAKMIQCFSVLQCLVSVYMTTDGVRKKMKAFTGFVEERIERRLAKPESKPDLCGLGLIHDENGTIMSRDEMSNNAVVFMLGGTETTAAHLAAITYLLLRHPDKMTRLTKELGAAVKCEDDMTVEKLAKVEYLNACIEEGLRIFPPTPAGLPRITPAGDSMIIDGHVIPGGTKVAVPSIAASRNPSYWSQPDQFIPERWLEESTKLGKHAGDTRKSSQPFSLGRRGCIGKNVAYHIIRLILAKLLLNFDLALCGQKEDWLQQKNFIVWERPPLNCHLRLRGDVKD